MSRAHTMWIPGRRGVVRLRLQSINTGAAGTEHPLQVPDATATAKAGAALSSAAEAKVAPKAEACSIL